MVVSDVEGEDGDRGALVLGDQAGLAVDGAFQDRQRWCAGDEIGQVTGDLLGAFVGVQGGGGQTAAVRGDGRVGVEQGDDGGDVTGLPGSAEVADDRGLPGGGDRPPLPAACKQRPARRRYPVRALSAWKQLVGTDQHRLEYGPAERGGHRDV
jgi:hypothetical protein